jgi:hypothetical protein
MDTCCDESSPPCRRVSDTSGVRCGPPSAVCLSVSVFVAFHLSIVLYVFSVVAFADALTFSVFQCFVCRRLRLNASLPCAVLAASGSWFQLSTTLTAKEYFLTSVRAYCVTRQCAVLVCLVLAPSLFSLVLWSMFIFGSLCINLCTNAMSCFCLLSYIVSSPSSVPLPCPCWHLEGQ